MEKEKTNKKETNEEKKETVVEEKKDYSIEETNQKRLKGFSKAIYIIANIVRSFIIIGMVGIGIAMVTIPMIANSIKAEPYKEVGKLKIFGTEIEYTRSEEKITIYEKDDFDEKVEIEDKSDVETLNKLLKHIEDKDLTKLGLLVEFELIVVMVLLFIDLFIAKKVHLLFKNIYEKDSPFILENIDIIKSGVKLLIYSFVITIVLNIINSFIMDTSTEINMISIVEILAVFCVQYIFEYGYKLQKETKGRIYSE